MYVNLLTFNLSGVESTYGSRFATSTWWNTFHPFLFQSNELFPSLVSCSPHFKTFWVTKRRKQQINILCKLNVGTKTNLMHDLCSNRKIILCFLSRTHSASWKRRHVKYTTQIARTRGAGSLCPFRSFNWLFSLRAVRTSNKILHKVLKWLKCNVL